MSEVTKCPECYTVYRHKHICKGTQVDRLKARVAELERNSDYLNMPITELQAVHNRITSILHRRVLGDQSVTIKVFSATGMGDV